jgi:CheY-like chemotaxis protein
MAAPLLRQHATATTDLQILDILESSAKRGTSLVRQVLAFSHGAGGGRLQPMQFRHLFRELRDFLGASFPKSIVLEEDVAPDLWPFLADPTQIHQVLLNLCVNARDAMLPRGGTLRLGAANASLDGPAAAAFEGGRPGDFVVFEVGDTGSGMTPETLARIWEPFFTTKAEGHGTGLGLSTVRGIVARHHGFITVKTIVGHGTTFRFFLPAAESRGAEPPSSRSPFLPRGSGELVLVVDDEPSVCEIACRILTQFGYRAFGCSDGVEAINYFTSHAADVQLVITDVNMPKLDGPSLALVLQRLRPDLKILAMSGLEAAGPAGSPHFTERLQKPFTAERLLLTVNRLLPAVPQK